MKRAFWIAAIAIFVPAMALSGLVGCEDGHDHSSDAPATTDKEATKQAEDHGDEVDLGTLTIASREFQVSRFGEAAAGKECAFEVEGVGISESELAKLNLYLWLEDSQGTQLSAPAKGERKGSHLHFHAAPREGKGEPHRVVLRLRADGTDERAGLPLDGHGHEHTDGPHHGIVAAFHGDRGTTGTLELKLHDDKGDLELWLAKDEQISSPFDLPLDTAVEVEFVDVNGRKVQLRVRNQEKNEDEEGNANVRNNLTNYFIFPSSDGEDASWLQGTEFSSIVIVRFSGSGEKLQSDEFVLKPHTH